MCILFKYEYPGVPVKHLYIYSNGKLFMICQSRGHFCVKYCLKPQLDRIGNDDLIGNTMGNLDRKYSFIFIALTMDLHTEPFGININRSWIIQLKDCSMNTYCSNTCAQ